MAVHLAYFIVSRAEARSLSGFYRAQAPVLQKDVDAGLCWLEDVLEMGTHHVLLAHCDRQTYTVSYQTRNNSSIT